MTKSAQVLVVLPTAGDFGGFTGGEHHRHGQENKNGFHREPFLNRWTPGGQTSRHFFPNNAHWRQHLRLELRPIIEDPVPHLESDVIPAHSIAT